MASSATKFALLAALAAVLLFGAVAEGGPRKQLLQYQLAQQYQQPMPVAQQYQQAVASDQYANDLASGVPQGGDLPQPLQPLPPPGDSVHLMYFAIFCFGVAVGGGVGYVYLTNQAAAALARR